MNPAIYTKALRRTLKFLHTLGAAGFTGGMAALAVVLIATPASIGSDYAPLIGAMARIAAWLIAPSMILTVISGLLAMAVNPAFYDVGWVWLKLATGILILEGGLHVLGPLQEEAKRGAAALTPTPDPAAIAGVMTSETNTLWTLIAVAAVNIALGVWRPRLPKGWLES